MASFNFKRKCEKINRRRPRLVDDDTELHVVVLQRTAKKCAKIYNARAKLFSFSFKNLLFGDVLVAIVARFYAPYFSEHNRTACSLQVINKRVNLEVLVAIDFRFKKEVGCNQNRKNNLTLE